MGRSKVRIITQISRIRQVRSRQRLWRLADVPRIRTRHLNTNIKRDPATGQAFIAPYYNLGWRI